MAKWFSIAAVREWYLRRRFSFAGLKSTTTDFSDGTIMHCWVPRHRSDSKPNLLLIHGFGANAMWQFTDFVGPVARHFNLYVPDLLFFGGSTTTRPERSDSFQAQCIAVLMEGHGVRRMHVAGLSYGGFVGYCLAAQFKERVERVVLCCAGVSVEEKDVKEGLMHVESVEELVSVLLPQTPAKARDLLKYSFYKPITKVPNFLLKDFVKYLYSEQFQEREELLHALFKNRKFVDLPKITQPTLCIWGEYDLIFPMELADRLKRHLGDNVQIVTIKNAGHALNAEKPKEVYKHIKSFLLGPLPPTMTKNPNNAVNGDKVE
ncbi:monoacylglycerol lipase abhd6-B [Morus notabilis]|uniref:monoacylglycerol lipase abhd6-B n=1 Tax=Morus notabilis TaxID=981085 RepID=UPI000CECEDE7|nr:monoacylglycerol lipase abhd6-B [Morus notabilis]